MYCAAAGWTLSATAYRRGAANVAQKPLHTAHGNPGGNPKVNLQTNPGVVCEAA